MIRSVRRPLLPAWLALVAATPAYSQAPAAGAATCPRVGDEAPDVLGISSDGDASAVRPWRWSGRYTLLVFWSPDDPASVRQIKALRRLHREFGDDERFQIVGVATVPEPKDTRRDAWNDWIEFMGRQPEVIGPDGSPRRFHLAWTQLFEAEVHEPRSFPPDDRGLTTSGRYGVAGLPASFLIGPDGRLAAARIPTGGLRRAVAKALSGGR